MARTAWQIVAFGITMAVAISGGNNLYNVSFAQEPGQDELRIEHGGKQLFEKETFGGNGRTCQTCHSKRHGHSHPGRRAANHR